MKSLFVLCLALASPLSHASGNSCEDVAEHEIATHFVAELKGRQIRDVSCESDGTDVVLYTYCSVSASGLNKSEGKITFGVKLDENCEQVTSSEVTDEE